MNLEVNIQVLYNSGKFLIAKQWEVLDSNYKVELCTIELVESVV